MDRYQIDEGGLTVVTPTLTAFVLLPDSSCCIGGKSG
jgi:hypothetical protein